MAALCCKNQRPYVFLNGPTFTVLVMLRIEYFLLPLKNNYPFTWVCAMWQKPKTRPGNHSRLDHYSGPIKGKHRVRTTRKQN